MKFISLKFLNPTCALFFIVIDILVSFYIIHRIIWCYWFGW